MSRNVILAGARLEPCQAVAGDLGERLGRGVVDLHAEVERWKGSPWPSLVAEHGEKGAQGLLDQIRTELSRFGDLIVTWEVPDDRGPLELMPSEVLVVVVDRGHSGGVSGQMSDGGQGDAGLRIEVEGEGELASVADVVASWLAEQGDVLTPSEYEQVVT